VTTTGSEWLEQLAARLGVDPPSDEELNDLLALAGIAARTSERTAAPVSCWLVARAGVTAAQGRVAASELAAELASELDAGST
jgi:predicted component of type VI protein secretion system